MTGSLFENEQESGSSGGWIIANCDGGSRGNPGPSGYGVHMEDSDGRVVAEISEFLGRQTNNYAEYSGLLAALDYALQRGYSRLRVIADSELMVKQIKGQYRVNSVDLKPLYEEAKRRISRLDRFEIQHVLRGKNKHADRLANLAMDRGSGKTVTEGAAAIASASSASSTPKAPSKPKAARGFVKNGVVHLLEGELPEGVFVKVIPE